MFIRVKDSGYNRHDEQFCNGDFLIIAQDHNSKDMKPELRCIIRYTHFEQFGHWMMGQVRIGHARLVLSGDYGSDGLPYNLISAFKLDENKQERISLAYANVLFSSFHLLPAELQCAFWSGGGWNSGGKEKEPLKKWALDNEWNLRLRNLQTRKASI